MASMSASEEFKKDDDEDGNVVLNQKFFNGHDNSISSTPAREPRKFPCCFPTFQDTVHDKGWNVCRLTRAELGESLKKSNLRHRCGSRQVERQSQDKLQRSNVPGSSTTSSPHERRDVDEQLSRLKSACHYALVSFLHESPSLTNNNVKGSPTKGRNGTASRLRRPQERDELKSSSTQTKFRPGDENELGANGRTTSSSLLFSLYKFLNLIATVVLMFLKLVLVIFTLVFILYCLMVLHKPTQAFVSSNTQDLIYPFMRTIRFGSLQLVSRFPQLHEFYEDACVLANPFFEMNDVSCWPCESVRHVIDLTGFSNFTSGYYHSGIPFIVKDAFSQKVGIEDLYGLYEGEKKLWGNVLLQSNCKEIQTLGDLVKRSIKSGNFLTGSLHITWKINRAQYARQLRRYFSRPYYIPNATEIAVQHFLFIDEPASEQYELPVTEFANAFVMQADGQRLIKLVPVRHCRATCKAISVVLKPNDVLFYNWLFWRPISFPMTVLETKDEGLSVSYVGSFY